MYAARPRRRTIASSTPPETVIEGPGEGPERTVPPAQRPGDDGWGLWSRMAIGAVAMAAVAIAGVGSLHLLHHGEVLPGVTVAGVDVGGLSPTDARAALMPVAQARGNDTVTLTFQDAEAEVAPDRVGFAMDLDATVDAAMDAGRDGSLLSSVGRDVSSLWSETQVEAVYTLDETALEDRVDELATALEVAPSPGAIDADHRTLEVRVVAPEAGVTIDRETAAAEIRAALRAPGSESIEVPAVPVPAEVALAEVEAVAEQARQALEAPVTVTANDHEVTLTPTEIAPMLELEQRDPPGPGVEVQLAARTDAVAAAFAAHTDEFRVDPVDASFNLPREPPVTFDDQTATTWSPVPVDVRVLPSTPGSQFDAELASAQLGELFRGGQRSAELRLGDLEAEFTTADARAFDITHLLGTFTTYHACCQTRVSNIQRLADMVDGATVPAGEQFSINEISGIRTCAKGFAPAGMILNGEIVDVCGGGVSQFGTTTFNAAFFAGVPIDAYKAHSFYISRYPMGREATLNYPSPDLDVKFTNDTGNGLLVKTSYTGTSITVSVYGNSDVETVRSTLSDRFDWRPFGTEVRENKALPPGGERVVQSGAAGFTVTVDRIISYTDGSTEERTFRTVYVPRRRIIERNSDPAPPPEPQPSPSEGADQPQDGSTSPEGGQTDDGSSGDGSQQGADEPSGDGSGGEQPGDGGADGR